MTQGKDLDFIDDVLDDIEEKKSNVTEATEEDYKDFWYGTEA